MPEFDLNEALRIKVEEAERIEKKQQRKAQSQGRRLAKYAGHMVDKGYVDMLAPDANEIRGRFIVGEGEGQPKVKPKTWRLLPMGMRYSPATYEAANELLVDEGLVIMPYTVAGWGTDGGSYERMHIMPVAVPIEYRPAAEQEPDALVA